MKIVVFVLSNIILTLILLELNLYFNKKCKEPNKMKNLLIFGISSQVVVFGSLVSYFFFARTLTLAERGSELPYGVMFWAVVMLLYLFKRFFKVVEIIIGKKA